MDRDVVGGVIPILCFINHGLGREWNAMLYEGKGGGEEREY